MSMISRFLLPVVALGLLAAPVQAETPAERGDHAFRVPTGFVPGVAPREAECRRLATTLLAAVAGPEARAPAGRYFNRAAGGGELLVARLDRGAAQVPGVLGTIRLDQVTGRWRDALRERFAAAEVDPAIREDKRRPGQVQVSARAVVEHTDGSTRVLRVGLGCRGTTTLLYCLHTPVSQESEFSAVWKRFEESLRLGRKHATRPFHERYMGPLVAGAGILLVLLGVLFFRGRGRTAAWGGGASGTERPYGLDLEGLSVDALRGMATTPGEAGRSAQPITEAVPQRMANDAKLLDHGGTRPMASGADELPVSLEARLKAKSEQNTNGSQTAALPAPSRGASMEEQVLARGSLTTPAAAPPAPVARPPSQAPDAGGMRPLGAVAATPTGTGASPTPAGPPASEGSELEDLARRIAEAEARANRVITGPEDTANKPDPASRPIRPSPSAPSTPPRRVLPSTGTKSPAPKIMRNTDYLGS